MGIAKQRIFPLLVLFLIFGQNGAKAESVFGAHQALCTHFLGLLENQSTLQKKPLEDPAKTTIQKALIQLDLTRSDFELARSTQSPQDINAFTESYRSTMIELSQMLDQLGLKNEIKKELYHFSSERGQVGISLPRIRLITDAFSQNLNGEFHIFVEVVKIAAQYNIRFDLDPLALWIERGYGFAQKSREGVSVVLSLDDFPPRSLAFLRLASHEMSHGLWFKVPPERAERDPFLLEVSDVASGRYQQSLQEYATRILDLKFLQEISDKIPERREEAETLMRAGLRALAVYFQMKSPVFFKWTDRIDENIQRMKQSASLASSVEDYSFYRRLLHLNSVQFDGHRTIEASIFLDSPGAYRYRLPFYSKKYRALYDEYTSLPEEGRRRLEIEEVFLRDSLKRFEFARRFLQELGEIFEVSDILPLSQTVNHLVALVTP